MSKSAQVVPSDSQPTLSESAPPSLAALFTTPAPSTATVPQLSPSLPPHVLKTSSSSQPLDSSSTHDQQSSLVLKHSSHRSQSPVTSLPNVLAPNKTTTTSSLDLALGRPLSLEPVAAPSQKHVAPSQVPLPLSPAMSTLPAPQSPSIESPLTFPRSSGLTQHDTHGAFGTASNGEDRPADNRKRAFSFHRPTRLNVVPLVRSTSDPSPPATSPVDGDDEQQMMTTITPQAYPFKESAASTPNDSWDQQTTTGTSYTSKPAL